MSDPATREDLIKEATALVRKIGYARVGVVANDLRIGYVTSSRVIEAMQERGILAEYDAGRAYWPAIPAPQPCGHDARYIWPPDASDPDDEHQPTRYCLKCAFDALGDAMTASMRDANDLRNSLNLANGRAVALEVENNWWRKSFTKPSPWYVTGLCPDGGAIHTCVICGAKYHSSIESKEPRYKAHKAGCQYAAIEETEKQP